ncbi:MAG: sugar phosphate isomerase/epimerase [Pseudolysinimonas sp.]|uniref:sugar phosphate isomerase/epimerase family protein n=1 Tax=Pseudolysinimonas sp. TaxID=2680009 RepID=UPI0032643E99
MMRRSFSKPVPAGEIDRLVDTYRAEGYEGLQLKQGQYLDQVADPEAVLTRWGDDPGTFSALIVFDTLRPDGLERLHDIVSFAAAVGSERVVFCHDHPRDGVDAGVLRGFAGILALEGMAARDQGVTLSLHHHFGQPVMMPEDFRVFFDAVGDTVGLTVDTAHLAKSGIDDIPAFIREFGSVIDNLHLKDYDGEQWRLLGEGDLPLADILAALDETGYTGWLCVDEESSASLDDGFRLSRAWLERNGR